MTEAPRIATLDVIRGVAVMGILAANIAAFGLPAPAYYSPIATGPASSADIAAWALTFVLVEGKMRGLFTFLFGASLLLVTDRAEVAGESAASVHYRRMAWLLLFGLVHLYLFWWGDILSHYAIVGSLAFAFRRLSARWLLLTGLMLVALEAIELAGIGLSLFPLHAAAHASGASPAAIEAWHGYAEAFGNPLPADLAAETQAMRSGFRAVAEYRWAHLPSPLDTLWEVGAETLGYMLIGMAAFRSGSLSGAWPRACYIGWAAGALAITLPLYAAIAALTYAHGFDARWVFLGSMSLATPLRPPMIVGYAALIILLARPGGWLTERIAAAGRMAFSNYLGTTLICTTIFDGYGFALFGHLSRADLYLVVLAIWIVMLAWSKPWLDRFRYGPLEWLWRSLARFEWQPMAKPSCERDAKTLAS